LTYLLDTNVVSELRRPNRADANVVRWAARSLSAEFYLSVITLLELEMGVRQVQRRDPGQAAILRLWIDQDIRPRFADRLFPIDETVALRCAILHVPNPMPAHDALIAATAIVHGMTIVTRNVADFVSTGVKLLNPWLADP
jgi:predicted nucleic acid-binding protein